jgi:phage shock protein C
MTNPTSAPFSNLSGKTLRRSRDQRMLSGVCGGLAEYLNVDATLVRLGVVALTIFTGGTGVIAYVIGWVVMPDTPALQNHYNGQVPPPQPTPEQDIAARIYDETPDPTKPAA